MVYPGGGWGRRPDFCNPISQPSPHAILVFKSGEWQAVLPVDVCSESFSKKSIRRGRVDFMPN
jgi:hypothetical protein